MGSPDSPDQISMAAFGSAGARAASRQAYGKTELLEAIGAAKRARRTVLVIAAPRKQRMEKTRGIAGRMDGIHHFEDLRYC